jgi:hypothetical protein
MKEYIILLICSSCFLDLGESAALKVLLFTPNKPLNPPMINSMPDLPRKLLNFLRIWVILDKKVY